MRQCFLCEHLKIVITMKEILKVSVAHLVWAAPALLDQDPNRLIMVVIGSQVDWKSALNLGQHWVSLCLKKFLHTGEVTLLTGEVERCEF